MLELAERLGIGGPTPFVAQEIAYRLGMEPPVLQDGMPEEWWVQIAYDLYLRSNDDRPANP